MSASARPLSHWCALPSGERQGSIVRHAANARQECLSLERLPRDFVTPRMHHSASSNMLYGGPLGAYLSGVYQTGSSASPRRHDSNASMSSSCYFAPPTSASTSSAARRKLGGSLESVHSVSERSFSNGVPITSSESPHWLIDLDRSRRPDRQRLQKFILKSFVLKIHRRLVGNRDFHVTIHITQRLRWVQYLQSTASTKQFLFLWSIQVFSFFLFKLLTNCFCSRPLIS